MSKILIAGAGGTPSEKSLLECETIIGMGSEPSDLILSKYIIPYAVDKEYKNKY